MKNPIRNVLLMGTSILFIFAISYAEEEHNHSDNENKNVEKEQNHDHEENHGHEEESKDDSEHKDHENDEYTHNKENSEEHGEEHEENESAHDEESTAVGPGKGIIEKSEKGFKLSSEAKKTFKLEFITVTGQEFELPKSAQVLIKNNKYVYRMRDDWIERIPIKIISKTQTHIKVIAEKVASGDQIIIIGTGFIRGSELILSEGATHSH